MAKDTPQIIRYLKHILNRMSIWQKWVLGVGLGSIYCLLVYNIFVSPTGFRWRAIYGEPNYPKGYNIHGIDISRYQNTINWNRLKNALIDNSPIRFVFVKSTEGDSHLDSKFKENFGKAKEYGFVRGAYHFWSNNASARRQAYFFLAMVELQPGDFPPVLDIESKPQNISTEDFQQNILTWLHIVEDRYHVRPIIYTYYKFKTLYLSDNRFDEYPYWIAHYYVNQMEYKGPWKFWQHTDAGRLPGISGYVDLDIYNGSYYDLQQLLIPDKSTLVEEADSTNHDSIASDTLSD